jgi:benzoyl-CoA reductase/2-hydroxyglutaryl-CoA dehydratase subunit BcrC/BadD/HgdB
VEVIHAAGFLPVRLMGEAGPVQKADYIVPTFICPYLRRVVENGLRGDYDFLHGVVQGYTCDVSCGLINIWQENMGGVIAHTVPLPYNNNPEGEKYFRAAMQELVDKLCSRGGVFSEDTLTRSLDLYRDIRTCLADIYRMRSEERHCLSASDLLSIVQAGFVTSPNVYLEMLRQLLSHFPEADHDVHSTSGGVPILVSGSVVESPRMMAVIEESGARVVADDLCTGWRLFQPVDGQGDDPWGRLWHRHIHRFPCPTRSRVQQRATLLKELAGLSGARGIVFLFQKYCTPHLADYPHLKQELGLSGLPSLVIEMEESSNTEGQLRTRLESFVEMLEARND